MDQQRPSQCYSLAGRQACNTPRREALGSPVSLSSNRGRQSKILVHLRAAGDAPGTLSGPPCSPTHVASCIHAFTQQRLWSVFPEGPLSCFLTVKRLLKTFPTLGNPPPVTSRIGREAQEAGRPPAPCSGGAALPDIHSLGAGITGDVSLDVSCSWEQCSSPSLVYFPIFIPIFTN